MEKVNSDSIWPEFNITFKGLEMLRKGGQVSTAWGSKRLIYIGNTDRHNLVPNGDSAVLDGNTLRIEVYLSDQTIKNPLYNYKLFSMNLGNLRIEPKSEKAEKEYGDLRIRLNFPK
jgi:hypothetical protein